MAAAKSDQRLQALEAQLAKQATQISEAWQHISTEEAADEAIHEHFAASLDGPRPKTGDSRPSSVQEDRTPPVHTAEEHAKVEEALAQSVHMLSMERIALHNTPSAHVPPPTIAEAPEAGDEASADAEGAAEPPPAPASGGGHAELVQDMSSVKVSRKLKDRLQFEMLSSDVAALADDLAARTRAMEAQMATVRSEIMAGLQTPPPTPPVTQGPDGTQMQGGLPLEGTNSFHESREEQQKLLEHREQVAEQMAAHGQSIKSLEEEIARMNSEIQVGKDLGIKHEAAIEVSCEHKPHLHSHPPWLYPVWQSLTWVLVWDLASGSVSIAAFCGFSLRNHRRHC